MRRAVLLAAALAAAAPAWAFRGDPRTRGDAARFGLDKPEPARRAGPGATRRAQARAAALRALGARVRYDPASGAVVGVSGRLGAPPAATPEAAAARFLSDNRDLFGVDPAALRLDLAKQAGGVRHLLYQQTLNGLPVEFSRVKVHVASDGEVLAVHSSYQPEAAVSAVPAVPQWQAAQAAGRDLGAPPPEWGTLVYLPAPKTGELRLAWKFKVSGPAGLWYYYVDARSAEVLLRYNDLRFQACPSGTSGTVQGEVFDVDPSSTPGPSVRGLPSLKVYMFNTAITTFAVADANGFFCNSGTSGKVFAALQGAHVNVAHFNKVSAQLDNGGGAWFIANTPVSSPHPYANGTAFPNSTVSIATINAVTPPSPPFALGSKAVKLIPHFSSFQVGDLTPEGDINDDDQVDLLDPDGNPVASYIGNLGAFNGAAVQGCEPCDEALGKPPLRLRLKANQTAQHVGYDVNISSVLALTNAPTTAANPSNLTFVATHTVDGTRDEINVYYHLNRMHDYFTGDVDKSSPAWISSPTVAMVHFGPGLANAFYNPDHDNFAIGDAAGAIALDATVIHHEYVHFVVDKIYPILNFGQNGAISEGNADYFAASSLNEPAIGKFANSAPCAPFCAEAALRDLACVPGGTPACKVYPASWVGEIHNDSLPLSQALWEIRADLIGLLGAAAGRSCADGLAFQSLFYFPGSFQEYLDAMLLVDATGGVAACGGANTRKAEILARFSSHGIVNAASGDANEFNDGAQSATDISTRSAISGTIFPAGDLDFFAFGAAPGMIRATLRLPPTPSAPGDYEALSLTLVDRQLRVVAETDPLIDNPTAGGQCPNLNCRTAQPSVTLSYNNPSPDQFYLIVQAAPTDVFSNSATNDPALIYTLLTDYTAAGAIGGSIVSAVFDNDTISFSVNVSSFVTQNSSFTYAQLRDQSLTPLPNTRTDGAAPFLLFVSSSGAGGRITGTLRVAPGFAARFPSVGTVYLEVFGFNRLQLGKAQDGDPLTAPREQSLGLSPALNLTTTQRALSAWNNVFNPRSGQKATFKYETTQPGHVSLRLYTMQGRLVSTLLDGDFPAGKGSVDWAGINYSGRTVASGIYLLRLEAPGFSKTQKVVVVK